MKKLGKYMAVALSALTAITLVTQTLRAEDDDDAISPSQVPAAALAALQARANGAAISKIEKNDEDGTVSYEAQFVVNGKKQEVTVDASGKVIGEEVEITVQEVPAPALAALQNSAPGGTITKVVREIENGVTTFEASISLNGKVLKAETTATGGPVADEKEDKEHDDKD